jgi:hypothetical protein
MRTLKYIDIRRTKREREKIDVTQTFEYSAMFASRMRMMSMVCGVSRSVSCVSFCVVLVTSSIGSSSSSSSASPVPAASVTFSELQVSDIPLKPTFGKSCPIHILGQLHKSGNVRRLVCSFIILQKKKKKEIRNTYCCLNRCSYSGPVTAFSFKCFRSFLVLACALRSTCIISEMS